VEFCGDLKEDADIGLNRQNFHTIAGSWGTCTNFADTVTQDVVMIQSLVFYGEPRLREYLR